MKQIAYLIGLILLVSCVNETQTEKWTVEYEIITPKKIHKCSIVIDKEPSVYIWTKTNKFIYQLSGVIESEYPIIIKKVTKNEKKDN